MSDSHSTPEHANASNEREDLSAEDLQKVSGARKLFETLELFAGLNPAEIQEIAASANTLHVCLLYTSPSPRDVEESRMPSSA